MTGAIATILPYALGAAISPLLMTVEVIILAGGVKPKQRAWLYAAGAAIVAALLLVLFAFVFRSLDLAQGPPSPIERGVEIMGALVLGALALKSFLPAHASETDKPSRLHEWMQRGKGRDFFVIGMLIMATNLSSIVIIIPGVHAIEAQRPGAAAAIVALSIAFVLLMAPALLPVGLATLFGQRSDAFLHRVNLFVTKHSRTITGLICLGIAIYLAVGAFT
jgi:hypothetical protein